MSDHLAAKPPGENAPTQRVCACLLSRDPFRVRSGRTSVLRTAIKSLASRFQTVHCVVFEPAATDDSPAQRPINCQMTYVGSPSVFRSPLGKAARVLGGHALNEALFYARSQMQRTRDAVDHETSLVYCDSIRLAQYARSLGHPWILDLDDLLSSRFAQYLQCDQIDVTQVLGHFGSLIPGPLKTILGLALRPLLRWESRRLSQREVYWARSAPAASLVSKEEASTLGKLANRKIRVLPMSVPDVDRNDVWPTKVWHRGDTIKLVFVGYLAYRPNLEAMGYLAGEVVGALTRAGIDSSISIVGNIDDVQVPESVKKCPAIVLRGFVDDLNQEFARQHAFIAPIFSGTGVKTKVLEAMRYGIPVLGTPMAFSGISMPGKQLLCWSRAAEIPALITQLSNLDGVIATSERGRAFVQNEFSSSVIDARWQDAIASTARRAGESAA